MNVRPSFDPNPSVNQTNYYWFDKVFSSEDLSDINKLQNLYPYEVGTVVGGDENKQIPSSIRKSNVKWIYHDIN